MKFSSNSFEGASFVFPEAATSAREEREFSASNKEKKSKKKKNGIEIYEVLDGFCKRSKSCLNKFNCSFVE
jgi:hypothetical protein